MNRNYPMEGFALAMIVFTLNMQEAMLTGIILLLVTVLGMIVYQIFEKLLPSWSSKACTAIFIVAVNLSLQQIIVNWYFHNNSDTERILLQLAVGALIAKHVLSIEDFYYGRLLYEGALAYGGLILIGLFREFMALGSIFNFQIADYGFMTESFLNVIIGLLLTGVAIAILNHIFDYEVVGDEGFWVLLPVVLLYQPFVIEALPELLSAFIAIIATVIMMFSVRMFLTFSNISRYFKKLPIELLSTSIIYMILMVF
ncbi:MAG: hypothetical protein GX915_05375 [Clostridiales bacterium]|nr:hypothetical protein [Clostridiales bacterium]